MGLAIALRRRAVHPAESAARSRTLFWDGPFPGGDALLPRLFIVHVFICPGD